MSRLYCINCGKAIDYSVKPPEKCPKCSQSPNGSVSKTVSRVKTQTINKSNLKYEDELEMRIRISERREQTQDKTKKPSRFVERMDEEESSIDIQEIVANGFEGFGVELDMEENKKETIRDLAKGDGKVSPVGNGRQQTRDSGYSSNVMDEFKKEAGTQRS